MLRNYLSVAFRHLRRSPLYSSINVAGLAVGIAACLLLAVYVRDELAFDRHFPDRDRLVRIIETRTSGESSRRQAVTPPALAAAVVEDVPQVESAARLFSLGRVMVERDESRFFEPTMYLADSTFFDTFGIRLRQGDEQTALTLPNTLILSTSLARKVFGKADPVGRTLTIDGDDEFTVTGVIADSPRRSHVDLSLVGSFQTLYGFQSAERLSNWIWQQFFTYVRLRGPDDAAPLAAALPGVVQRRAAAVTEAQGFRHEFEVQPVADVYLRSGGLFFDPGPRGSASTVFAMAAIAVFVLLIACFNFMNLSTARSMTRAREIGMRKVAGAHRGQLVRQFLGESTLVAAAGFVLAVGLVIAAARPFTDFTGKPVALDAPTAGILAASALVVLLIVGIGAGLYPALYLSALRPITVLRSLRERRPGFVSVRRTLVVLQFTIGVALLAGTTIAYRQIRYVQTRDFGFNRDRLVRLSAQGDIGDHPETFKQEVLRSGAVESVSASYGAPGSFAAGDGVYLPGRESQWPLFMMLVDYDFLSTWDMRLVAGRGFDPTMGTDDEGAFILNEAAARNLGKTPGEVLGQHVSWPKWGEDTMKEGEVVGVVADFNFESLHREVQPIVLHVAGRDLSHVTARLARGRVQDGMAALESVWNRMVPDRAFEPVFVDDDLASDYAADRQVGTLIALFSGLALLIACLGLFALASFTVERRTREIGIRKVLGASETGVSLLVAREFLPLVVVSVAIASPLAWLAMTRWLETFAYRVEPGPWLFIGVGFVAVLVAGLTVSGHSLRAARMNPVESLGRE